MGSTIIKNGIVTLGNFQLSIPDLTLSPTCTYIVGSNGAGKSTLIKTILGLINISTGEKNNFSGDCGYVPQNYRATLFPWLSAADNVQIYRDDPIILKHLNYVGFSQKDLSKRPHLLSGGQCQRLAVIREITSGFNLIALDEPFSGLDTTTVPLMGTLLANICKEGVRLVITSHTEVPDILLSLPNFQTQEISRTSDHCAVVSRI